MLSRYEVEAVLCTRLFFCRISWSRIYQPMPSSLIRRSASLEARPSPEWLKSGTIYQIFVRSFSPSGDLNGVTARLDDLHTLGRQHPMAHAHPS